MAEIKKVTFGKLIEEFDPYEKSLVEFEVITGKFPAIDSEESFFRHYETVFEEICKNAGGSQIIIRFPEFLYYMLIDIYNQ